MANWTPARQLGCAGVVLGAVLCGAVALTLISQGRPASSASGAAGAQQGPELGPKDLVDEQRKLLAEQAQVVHDEVLNLHEERIALWKTRLEAKAETFRGTVREFDTIAVRNSCDVEVAVALYYMAIDGSWVTRGWWTIPPGETVETDAITRNDPVYFFAENQASGWLWDGKGREGSVELSVVDEKFDHLAGDRFVYTAPRTVSFYRRATGNAWTALVEEVACAAEAPEGTLAPRREPARAPGH